MNNKSICFIDKSIDDLMNTVIPDHIKDNAIMYEKERSNELKQHPKYLSIIKRLDEPIFVGDLNYSIDRYKKSNSPTNLNNDINLGFKYAADHVKDEDRGKELFFNVSSDLFEMIKLVSLPMEFYNIDLSIWKYKNWIICKAPELKDYMFNVYTLKKETDKKTDKTDETDEKIKS